MENRCKCLDLEGILENQAFAEYILQNNRYTIPGFGRDYELCTFDYGLEFSQCFQGSLTGRKPVGMYMHFSSYSQWTVEVDSVMDNESIAHEYLVCPVGEATRRFPMRIVCPDVLADTQQGDELYGQSVAFIASGTVLKGDAEVDNRVVAEDAHAVRIAGKISDIRRRTFAFESIVREYLELDIETDLGMISGVVLQKNLDAEPKIDDSIVAKAYISLDVAMPRKAAQSLSFDKKMIYSGLPGSREDCDYQCGYICGPQSAMRILTRAILPEGAFRFGRCCADAVQFVDMSGSVQTLDRWEVVRKLNDIFAGAKVVETVLSVKDKIKAIYFRDGILVDHCQYLIINTNEAGCVDKITQLSTEHYAHDDDLEYYLLSILANSMCHGKIYKLREVLGDHCSYRSDYSGKKKYGIRDILESISNVYKNLDETTAYRFEMVSADEEIVAEARTDLPGIFAGNWCFRLYQGEDSKPAAVVFLRYNASGKIENILLSRDDRCLKSFVKQTESKIEKQNCDPVDMLLQQKFGSDDTIRMMRQDQITSADEAGIYVWQKADTFIRDWFREKHYRLDSTELLDDCIGYACTRRGDAYAVYIYAYGNRKTSTLDGDYCSKLREHPLSRNRTILVIYLHVTAEENDKGETEFFVGRYNSKDEAPEVWKLGWIDDRSVLLFYPRKEMADLVRRLTAAYNEQRLDILRTLLSNGAALENMDGSTVMNDAVYGSLAYHHKNHGMMKIAYIRFNDVVYSEVPYLENYCYIHFDADQQNRISKIILAPLDESYRELYKTDLILMSHPMDEVPALDKVDFLPASDRSRFSMLLQFANGETRRYDAPSDIGDEDVVRWRRTTFTDKMFRNGRISNNAYLERGLLYSSYPHAYPGVCFLNGEGISTIELYRGSYPVGEFQYRDDTEIFILQEQDDAPFAVGRIHNLDPTNPLYLFNREKKIAKTIPTQYQDTPIICYPFCGGYSEGLLMVSTMGELDLQYHHNRYSCAGMWGWLDTDLNTVIEPKYVFAMNFWNGRAIVCKGEWITTLKDGKMQYWCENEGWGVIDREEREIVPCRFDELYEIDDTDRLYFVHEGGWESGHYAIYDVQEQRVMLELDFNFDIGYMFNECFVADDVLVFMDHLPGKGEDLIYAYDLYSKKYIAYAESYIERTLNGESKVIVNKDGQDIVVF